MFLDVRGETCPYPMKKAMEAMEGLGPDEILEVAVDHPPAIETIRMAANRYGFSMEVYPLGSGEWRLILRRQNQEVQV
ncbi:MAG: sulfurtransferase TusA family protein [bacterium]